MSPSLPYFSLRRLLSSVDVHRFFPYFADFAIIFERDPAARNWLEVLCCYPGLHAIAAHRLAHWLQKHTIPFFPRFISHLARLFTGIEIHPGATLGKGVFIDHGMGIKCQLFWRVTSIRLAGLGH